MSAWYSRPKIRDGQEKNLDAELALSAKAFVKLRYSYEFPGESFTLAPLAMVTRQLIATIKPDWKFV